MEIRVFNMCLYKKRIYPIFDKKQVYNTIWDEISSSFEIWSSGEKVNFGLFSTSVELVSQNGMEKIGKELTPKIWKISLWRPFSRVTFRNRPCPFKSFSRAFQWYKWFWVLSTLNFRQISGPKGFCLWRQSFAHKTISRV